MKITQSAIFFLFLLVLLLPQGSLLLSEAYSSSLQSSAYAVNAHPCSAKLFSSSVNCKTGQYGLENQNLLQYKGLSCADVAFILAFILMSFKLYLYIERIYRPPNNL